MVRQVVKRKPSPTAATPRVKYSVDCTQAQKDNIIDPAGLEKFLVDRVKFEGKTGNFEKLDKERKVVKNVVVTREGPIVYIESFSTHMSKRYVKYLTKKYLSKQQIRDFLRVISTTKTGYVLRYFANAQAANAED